MFMKFDFYVNVTADHLLPPNAMTHRFSPEEMQKLEAMLAQREADKEAAKRVAEIAAAVARNEYLQPVMFVSGVIFFVSGSLLFISSHATYKGYLTRIRNILGWTAGFSGCILAYSMTLSAHLRRY